MKLTIPILVPKKIAEETFKADIRFKTKSQITKRTINVAEAFGIGIDDDHEFVIFDNFTLEINKGDIVYITGTSGSGKSLLLKQLTANITNSEQFGKVITDRDIEKEIDPDKPLIEQIGNDVSEAIKILSIVGLNEAFLMLRKYCELSDGQKYRFKLAKMIDLNVDTWIMDEFLALLDRTTAKVVAYTIQKAARKLNRTVIIATTHTDLDQDLNPDVRVFKHFGSKVDVGYRKVRKRPCSLLKKIRIEKGNKQDYEELKQFHYISSDVRFVRAIYRAVLSDEIIGVIIYGTAYLSLRARSIALPHLKIQKGEDRREHAKRINKSIVRIWRVVIDPKYRGTGIAQRLIRESMPKAKVPYVEVMAVMARYSRVFDACNMVRVPEDLYLHYDKSYEKALEKLQSSGFDLELLSSKRYNMSVLQKLDKEKVKTVRDIAINHFTAHAFRTPSLKNEMLQGNIIIEAIAKALAGKRLPYAYLVWKNLGSKYKKLPEPCVLSYEAGEDKN